MCVCVCVNGNQFSFIQCCGSSIHTYASPVSNNRSPASALSRLDLPVPTAPTALTTCVSGSCAWAARFSSVIIALENVMVQVAERAPLLHLFRCCHLRVARGTVVRRKLQMLRPTQNLAWFWKRRCLIANSRRTYLKSLRRDTICKYSYPSLRCQLITSDYCVALLGYCRATGWSARIWRTNLHGGIWWE